MSGMKVTKETLLKMSLMCKEGGKKPPLSKGPDDVDDDSKLCNKVCPTLQREQRELQKIPHLNSSEPDGTKFMPYNRLCRANRAFECAMRNREICGEQMNFRIFSEADCFCN